jgi:hypothetical protein
VWVTLGQWVGQCAGMIGWMTPSLDEASRGYTKWDRGSVWGARGQGPRQCLMWIFGLFFDPLLSFRSRRSRVSARRPRASLAQYDKL